MVDQNIGASQFLNDKNFYSFEKLKIYQKRKEKIIQHINIKNLIYDLTIFIDIIIQLLWIIILI